jgi:hypothetical protein
MNSLRLFFITTPPEQSRWLNENRIANLGKQVKEVHKAL